MIEVVRGGFKVSVVGADGAWEYLTTTATFDDALQALYDSFGPSK